MATADFQPTLNHDLSAAIASGQTTSGEIDLKGCALVGLHMPASFTGTTLTFTASNVSGGTFRTLYNAGGDVSVTVAASKFVRLDPTVFVGVRWLKIISGSSEGADRTIILATRPV